MYAEEKLVEYHVLNVCIRALHVGLSTLCTFRLCTLLRCKGMAIGSPYGWRLRCATCILLLLLHAGMGALPEEAVFVPGTLPLDTDGKEVLAVHT